MKLLYLLASIVFFLGVFSPSQAQIPYQLANVIPYSWIELGPGSLTPGTEFFVNNTCARVNLNPPITFYGTNFSFVSVSRHGFISFPDPDASQIVCFSTTLNALFNPGSQCPFPLQASQAFGTGIAVFYGYTTQNVTYGARQFYRYFPTCPYPGLATHSCHVFQYNSSLWDGFIPSFAVTAEAIVGSNGAVILQYKKQASLWFGALVGVQRQGQGTPNGVSYPGIGDSLPYCPWGNSSEYLSLENLALAFYPQNQPIPCDSNHNITFTNATGQGCTCPDFDNDGFVCPENDACPFDSTKIKSVGVCGCGVPDTDSDGDGYADCVDACPSDPNKWLSPGLCGCGKSDYKPGTYAYTCGSAGVLSSWASSALELWISLF